MSDTESSQTSVCRLLVVGRQLSAFVSGRKGFGEYAEVVECYDDEAEWLSTPQASEVDLFIIYCPSLFPETVATIRERVSASSASRAVVVYEFSNEATRELIEAESASITTLRAPVTPRELKLACEADIALATLRTDWSMDSLRESADLQPQDAGDSPLMDENEGIPARLYSDEQIAQLTEISSAVECECPHQLSALLSSLNAFEEYSRKCEDRNEDDAVLHAYLHRATANARSRMEEALSVLLEVEKIELD